MLLKWNDIFRTQFVLLWFLVASRWNIVKMPKKWYKVSMKNTYLCWIPSQKSWNRMNINLIFDLADSWLMSCAKGCFKGSFWRCFTKSLERLNKATLLLIDQRIISFGSFYYSFKKTEMHFQMSSDQSEATAKRVVSTDYHRWFLLSFSSSYRNHPIFFFGGWIWNKRYWICFCLWKLGFRRISIELIGSQEHLDCRSSRNLQEWVFDHGNFAYITYKSNKVTNSNCHKFAKVDAVFFRVDTSTNTSV